MRVERHGHGNRRDDGEAGGGRLGGHAPCRCRGISATGPRIIRDNHLQSKLRGVIDSTTGKAVTVFLNDAIMRDFTSEQFGRQQPYPWFSFEQFLRPSAFDTLLASFPSVALFEEHKGIERANQQRSHDRYYLAFEKSIYRDAASPEAGPTPLAKDGVVGLDNLPTPWQDFIGELRDSSAYRAFTESLLGHADMTVRFAWHMGFSGSEVSPHRDAEKKVGTHIFYFNTSRDWEREWGGSILVLGGKQVKRLNPNVGDFDSVIPVDIRDNRSFLFKNTQDAWHGVEPLSSPGGAFRRLFNVVFEYDGPVPQRKKRGLLGLFGGR